MRRGIVVALLLAMVAVTMAVASAAAMWLLHTESGLVWLTGRLGTFAGKGLTLDGVAGTLAGGARIEHLRYAGKDIEVRVRSASLRLVPSSLLTLEPRIADLTAEELSVTSKPSEPRGEPPDSLELPVDFHLTNAYIARLVIDLGQGPVDITHVHLVYDGGEVEHRVRDLSLHAFGHAISLRGSIAARAPFRLAAAVAAVRAEAPAGSIYAAVTGTLSEIEIEGGGTSSGGRLKASATVRPYEAVPVSSARAQVSGLDLRKLSQGLPQTAIEGAIELKRSGPLLAGPLKMTNAAPGPYDKGRLPLVAVRADVSTDADSLRIASFAADLGNAGSISGRGTIARERADLELKTLDLNLAGLHARMRRTALRGEATLTLQQSRQSMTAELSQEDIALRLTAHREGDAIEVSRFQARARGGEANGKVEINLAARKPYSVEAAFTRFDPAAWGHFPQGSINGELTARGSLDAREAEVRFAVRDSRWLNAPLAASGTVSLIGETLRQAAVEATLGGNRFSAQGALGTPGSTLAVRFDAPRLGLLHKRLQGTARGNAVVSGAWRALDIRFDASGANLGFDGLGRIKAIDARGRITPDAAGPVDIEATLRGVATQQWLLRSAMLKLDGTRAAHALNVTAEGERVDFRASARGGWREGVGWSGTVQELVNRGEAAVTLLSPVALVAGPQRVQIQPFELNVIGGRLSVARVDYVRGKLTTNGRFADLPLRPVLALAGVPAQMAGTLRLSGNWSLDTAPRLLGSITVARESGDVSLGAGAPVKVGLETLAINAKFGDQGVTFDARLRSAIATANAEGRVAASGGGIGYSGASALNFTAGVNIARLAPFASFIDTTMLLDGEAHAKLEGRGTLADPQITGPLTIERLAIALPAEGVDLKSGTLRAVLTPREVRVDSFSIRGGDGMLTARGTLARAGFDEASMDWQAQQFTVLSRPDRRLVVSGKGNAALHGGKLAFIGSLRADEGLFELATTTLPKLGNDVVVVGRQAPVAATAIAAVPPPKARTPQRADLDLTIELGNKVHLTGRGLDAWLSGTVRVHTGPGGDIRATGTVDARRGIFVAYGQRLEIDRGRLFFNGAIGNPGLDILAMRKRQAVEAGVAVTGTLSQPLVRVVSDPPLPEGEALSWLLLGRAPDQTGSGQLSALPLAAGAIAGRAGAPIANALKLDEFGLRSSGTNQFLAVGKRVTDRIYVVFEQGIGNAENLLRLEMSLTQRIALRAQAGTTSSIGLFYRYSWD